jgi:MFS family permease
MEQVEPAPNAVRVLILLFVINLVNFFDRAIPSVVIEPIRKEWGLSDFELGLVTAAFTVVYALAGLPLGRLADTGSRKLIIAWGLIVWSLLTGATGMAWSFVSFLVIRVGVGVGEAAYGPSAISLLGDLFPSNKRSSAMGIYMLGLPIGLILAFFTVGRIVTVFGTWRAPFFIAMIPGVLFAILAFFIKEPLRGAAEATISSKAPIDRPLRKLLRIPTIWWIILAGVGANFAAYSANGFLVPLFQRYFELPLEKAAIATGIIVGMSGLIGLTLGGWVADKIHQTWERGRLLFGVACLTIAAAATWFALDQGRAEIGLFTAVFAIGWLLQYSFYTTVYPALQDVVEPRLRSTAMALYFACLYLLGGALGPVVVGALSDYYAKAAMLAANATEMNALFRAIGLHDSMYLIPASLLITAVFMCCASFTFSSDAVAMRRGMAATST